MWCRALLITAIITYLICVLLLSGLQKDDLDVKTLNKLQRYNVNIDNLTYNNSPQECLTKATLYIQENSKPIEIHNQNETIKIHHLESTINPTLQIVMKYFMELQKSHNDLAPENNTQNVLSNDPGLLEDIIRRRVKTDREPVVEVVDEIRQSNRNEINTTKRDIKLDQLLKTFEVFGKEIVSREINSANRNKLLAYIPSTKNNKLATPSTIYTDEKQNKRSNHNNIKQFSQLLSDLISNTSPTTTTEIINHDNISRQIERLLNVKSKFDNNMKFDKNFRRFNTNSNDENITQIRSTEKILKDKYEMNHNENERFKNNTIQYLNHFPGLDNSLLNSPNSQNTESYNSIKSSSIPYFSEYTGTNTENQVKNVNDKMEIHDDYNIKHFITNDVLKDISEKVKALVLKDLQKEGVTTLMSISTSTTTEKLTNKLPQEENTQEITKVMQKFMELYQQLQSMKIRSSIPTTRATLINPVTDRITAHQAYNIPIKVIIPPIVSLPNQLSNIPQDMVQLLYNPHLSVVTPISVPLLPMDKSAAVNSITQFNVFNNRHSQQSPAITMQTNSQEIPPLGIPIPKLLNPINQNIILTTKNPLVAFKGIQNGHKIQNNIYDYKEDNNNKDTVKYFDFAKRLRPREENGDDNYKAAYIDNFKMKYQNTDDVPFNKNIVRDDELRSQNRAKVSQLRDRRNYHHEAKQYKPYSKMTPEERERFQNENIKSFHERLERTDDWERDSREYIGSRDCSKIPERQQRPMKDTEYPKYDDTHFQNFMKTQQKVNNMLERILATKTIPDRPRSVELP